MAGGCNSRLLLSHHEIVNEIIELKNLGSFTVGDIVANTGRENKYVTGIMRVFKFNGIILSVKKYRGAGTYYLEYSWTAGAKSYILKKQDTFKVKQECVAE